MDDLKQQPESQPVADQPAPRGVYGPNDKPKGKATVVADEPADIFPVDNGEVDKPTEQQPN